MTFSLRSLTKSSPGLSTETAPSVDLRIGNDEHVYIVGTTGSGKSELAKHLLADTTRTIVLDTKSEFELDGFQVGGDLYQVGEFMPWLRKDDFRIIHRPPSYSKEADRAMAQLVLSVLATGRARIYVDELASVSNYYPMTELALSEVARSGRSAQVTLWAANQRPRNVPKEFQTEARVYFVFTLVTKADRKYLADDIGDDVQERIPLHTFWYYRPGMMEPALLKLDLDTGEIKEADNVRALR